MRITALPTSVDVTVDSRARQSDRTRFADLLREAADLIEQRELRRTERMSFAHVEFHIADDEP